MLQRQSIQKILTGVFVAAYAVALFAYFTHNVETNPQHDTQVIRFAQELNDAVYMGTFGTYLFEVRKYPLFYTLPFAALFRAAEAVVGPLSNIQTNYLARFLSLLFALGAFGMLGLLSKKILKDRSAVVLLGTSILFFQLATAVRPHIAETLWVLLTLWFSIRLREHGRRADCFWAFASALAAFCTLQNGLMAFIFPVYALWMRSKTKGDIAKAFLIAAVTALLAIPFGYPFLMGSLFGYFVPGVGLDLGHQEGMSFSLPHAMTTLLNLLGSDIILIVFAGLGLWQVIRHKNLRFPELVPIYFYIAVSIIVFAPNLNSNGRFFLSVLPLLALIGGFAYQRSSLHVRWGILLIGILIAVRLAILGFTPDTFQQMTAWIVESTEGKVGPMSFPSYFYLFPTDRLVGKDLHELRIILKPDSDHEPMFPGWHPCFHAKASDSFDDIILMWSDTSYALYNVLTARAMGPNLTAYCPTVVR